MADAVKVADPVDLDELDRLHAGTTPGEWCHVHGHGLGGGGHAIRLEQDGPVSPDQRAVIALHNTWPAVSAELRALRERVAELEAIACAATVLADAGPNRNNGPMWTRLWTLLSDRIRRSLVAAMQRHGLPFTERNGEWRSHWHP